MMLQSSNFPICTATTGVLRASGTQKMVFYFAEGPVGLSLTHNYSGLNFHYIVFYRQIYVIQNIVQLLWKKLNYVLNYLLLGNVHCRLFCTFVLVKTVKMQPWLQLLHCTNKFVWGIFFILIY